MNTAATAKFTTDDQRWEAVQPPGPSGGRVLLLRREDDRRVLPSYLLFPTAKRVNVRFFLTCGDAERGYQACKKCGPKASSPTPFLTPSSVPVG